MIRKTDKITENFEGYCEPRINLAAKTHTLLKCKEKLHSIAGPCDLKTMYDQMVMYALTLGIKTGKTRKKLFDLIKANVDRAIQLCRQEELSAVD